ncbi:MAG: sigma 54-interacting transcriptional regulator [Planctomycetes bacterium]|nr:sigma 54-interacting transcriptional regulator [Planctomycetota bacterium]
MHQAIRTSSGPDQSGLGIFEERQNILVVYVSPAEGHSQADEASAALPANGDEFPLLETEAASFAARPVTYVSPVLSLDRGMQIQRRFCQAGFRRYVSIPLIYDDRLLGALYACFRAETPPEQETVEHLEQLGRLLTPALWNHLTQARLALGDRRRATLIELSDAINTSLQMEPILQSARQALAQIEGHRVSIIALLREDARSFEAYWHPSPAARDQANATEPEILPTKATPLPWVVERRRTFESEDVQGSSSFEIDRRLAQLGVRRYVVAPMFVRGKIIGGLFFGTSDPHPALTTDVWLYENIALQLALAIDNARQFEQLKQLSDRLEQQNVYLREEIETVHNIEGMIGRSTGMAQVLTAVSRVAKTDAAVLITGPTGVGKELVARAIHAQSNRARHPLVKVNCAAIPDNLVESELFGHEKGAFTSAVARRIGRFELARDGTLFLDEVGELPLAIQVKLLRVLQDGDFERVGGTETLISNARIIAATNRDLAKAIESGSFRSDLFYRLNVFPIVVPSLSERRDDIPLLIESFMQQFNRRMGKQIESIDAQSMQYLCARQWPGNIRELLHVIERAMILCDGTCLTVEVTEPVPSRASESVAASAQGAAPALQSVELPPAVSTLEDAQREHIRRALQKTGGVVDGPGGAAAILGLKPSTLRSRMKRLGIHRRPLT